MSGRRGSKGNKMRRRTSCVDYPAPPTSAHGRRGEDEPGMRGGGHKASLPQLRGAATHSAAALLATRLGEVAVAVVIPRRHTSRPRPLVHAPCWVRTGSLRRDVVGLTRQERVECCLASVTDVASDHLCDRSIHFLHSHVRIETPVSL